jgi:hypothetical protein
MVADHPGSRFCAEVPAVLAGLSDAGGNGGLESFWRGVGRAIGAFLSDNLFRVAHCMARQDASSG